VGLVVTLGLLAWALHGVDARALIGHLRRANPWLMLETIALATCTFPLRAIRWRLILRGTSGSPLPLGPLWHATAIGFMANNLLPVRAGELARAYAARQALPVRFTTALASIAVERVFDGLLLVGLFTVALVVPSFPRDAMIGGVRLAGLATPCSRESWSWRCSWSTVPPHGSRCSAASRTRCFRRGSPIASPTWPRGSWRGSTS